MKILTLVWQNMRRMFTRHFTTLFVLFLGLAVSATALCVYYAQSASMLNTLTAYTTVLWSLMSESCRTRRRSERSWTSANASTKRR